MTAGDWDDLLDGPELRHGDRRVVLPMRYDADGHALVFTLPDGAGEVWLAVEETAQLAYDEAAAALVRAEREQRP